MYILRWLPYALLVTSAVYLMLYFDVSSIVLADFQTRILGRKNNISTPHYASAIFGGAHNMNYAEKRKYQQVTNINQANTREAVWKEIKLIGDNVSLYPAGFDVERIRDALRNTKLLHASKVKKATTYKWKLILEGNQAVLFKPRIKHTRKRFDYYLPSYKFRDRRLENATNPRNSCEYPEHEVTAFAINRLLDLRNMPFVAGRRFNWFTDILPVASETLRETANITQDGDVCFRHYRSCGSSKFICFPKGVIFGSMMVWLDTPVLELVPSIIFSYHTLYDPLKGLSSLIQVLVIRMGCAPVRGDNPRALASGLSYVQADSPWFRSLPLGNDTFCKWFRTTHKDYQLDRKFVNILDMAVLDYMMLSYDSRDTYIINTKKESVNVFVDRGKAFRHSDNDTLILAPIYQCCKIRAKVYKSLQILKDNFVEAFINETRTDKLHPILDNAELNAVQSRIHDILRYVDACIKMFSLRDVIMDV